MRKPNAPKGFSSSGSRNVLFPVLILVAAVGLEELARRNNLDFSHWFSSTEIGQSMQKTSIWGNPANINGGGMSRGNGVVVEEKDKAELEKAAQRGREKQRDRDREGENYDDERFEPDCGGSMKPSCIFPFSGPVFSNTGDSFTGGGEYSPDHLDWFRKNLAASGIPFFYNGRNPLNFFIIPALAAVDTDPVDTQLSGDPSGQDGKNGEGVAVVPPIASCDRDPNVCGDENEELSRCLQFGIDCPSTPPPNDCKTTGTCPSPDCEAAGDCPQSIPAPSSLSLLALGLVGFARLRKLLGSNA